MHKTPHIIFSFLLVSFLTAGASVAHAQLSGLDTNPLQYTISPEAPGPNSLVNIQIEGVGNFLGNATVTWQENGKTVQSGPGLSSLTFKTAGVGTVTLIHLIIDSATQGTITRDFTFAPSLVNLVWEANTSVPPFYLGKALYSAGSTLKVVAFPIVVQGTKLVAASKLSYQWTHDGNLDPTNSGLGKNAYTFRGDEIQPDEDVSVDVYLGTSKVAHGEVDVPATNPQVTLYSEDPLRGELLDHALAGTAALGTTEVTIKAEPYYFANESVQNNSLSYAWTLNSMETTGPDASQGLLTLRQTGSGAGAGLVGVSVQNNDNDKLTQSASAALTLAFGQSSGSALSSFFGL